MGTIWINPPVKVTNQSIIRFSSFVGKHESIVKRISIEYRAIDPSALSSISEPHFTQKTNDFLWNTKMHFSNILLFLIYLITNHGFCAN